MSDKTPWNLSKTQNSIRISLESLIWRILNKEFLKTILPSFQMVAFIGQDNLEVFQVWISTRLTIIHQNL
jgi:hypothetical protein